MKLAVKFMFVVLAVVMLMTAVGSYFSVRRGFERFERRQQQMARDTADKVGEQLADAWRKGGPGGVLEATKALSLYTPGHQVRWVWFEQTQVGSDGARRTVYEQIRINPGDTSTVVDRDGKRHLQSYYPMDLGDGPRGGLEISSSLESLDAAAADTIATALISLGAMAAISFGLVYFASVRWIARPLDRLIQKTERIGSGDFSEPLPERGGDELSQLARALNAMSDKLSQQQRQILSEATTRLATLEQLRHADRLKTVGRLAAGIAHELGTPLNVVSGRAGLIASGQLAEDEVVRSATTIKAEADRITGIIRQLLDFARRSAPQRTKTDLPALVRQTASLLKPLAEKRGIHIEIGAAEEATPIEVDPMQIQQVLTNLLINAIHSMSAGGGISIELNFRDSREPESAEFEPRAGAARPECVSIAVRDEGHGIAAEDLPHLFEPFFTTKEVGEGTGLGLSIAHGIIQEHGGWIDVASECGRGSCFTVFLPK